MMMANLNISIVIPTRYEPAPTLLKQLESVRNVVLEIVVIRNVSPAAKARNSGAMQAKGDYLLFLDDDVLLSNIEIIGKAYELLISDLSIGCVGCGLKVPQDSNKFQQALVKQVPRIELHENNKGPKFAPPQISGPFLLVPAKIFKAINGFDKKLPSSEDLDLIMRIKESGYKISSLPEAYVYHYPPKNLKDLQNKYFWYGRGEYSMIKKYSSNIAFRTCLHVMPRLILLPVLLFFMISRQTTFKLGFFPLKVVTVVSSLTGFVFELLNSEKQSKK